MSWIDRVLVFGAPAFLVGVMVSTFAYPGHAFGIACITTSVGLLFGSLVLGDRSRILFFALILLLGGIGALRYSIWESGERANVPNEIIGIRGNYEGVIVSDPKDDGGVRKFTVLIDRYHAAGGELRETNAKVLVFAPRVDGFAYGDRLELHAEIRMPEGFVGDSGNIFDYPMYLRAKGICCVATHPDINILASGEGNVIMAALYGAKREFLAAVGRALAEPAGSLGGGIFLGGGDSLGDVWEERFRVAGLIHIVVLSGYNMTIIAMWFGAIGRKLGFVSGIAFAAGAIILFAFASGGGATAVRAGIMAILALLARLFGRRYAMDRALLIAGVGMVAIDPGILGHDPSFQLSFLASLGLVYIAPIIEGGREHARPGLLAPFREAFITTIATQLAVLPLLLYMSGTLSLIAPIANVLALPAVPPAMFATAATGALGMISDALAFLPAVVASLLLSWILLITKLAAALPFAALEIGSFPAWGLVSCYALIVAFVWKFRPDRLPHSRDQGRRVPLREETAQPPQMR